jgi:hypothetical protein
MLYMYVKNTLTPRISTSSGFEGMPRMSDVRDDTSSGKPNDLPVLLVFFGRVARRPGNGLRKRTTRDEARSNL